MAAPKKPNLGSPPALEDWTTYDDMNPMVVKGITYKNNLKLVLLKIQSLLTCQIAQNSAQTSTLMQDFSFFRPRIAKLPKKICDICWRLNI
jgi:hypothetical protein